MQFYFFISIPIAGRASSLIGVETIITCIETKIFTFRRPCIELSDVIERSDKGRWAGSRCLTDTRLIDIDSVLNLFVTQDSIDGQVFVEFLHREILIMFVFILMHDRRSENIGPIPSFFQEFQPDETLDEFLFFIQKSK